MLLVIDAEAEGFLVEVFAVCVFLQSARLFVM